MITPKCRVAHSVLISIALSFCSRSHAQHALNSGLYFTNSPVIGGFRLTIATTNEYFTKGQPIVLKISVENISTNDAMFSVGLRPFRITITGPDGNQVPETEIGKQYLEPMGGSSFGLGLKPGESYRSEWLLSAYFAMTNSGEYYVTVLHNSNHENWLAGPLKIVITEPKASK